MKIFYAAISSLIISVGVCSAQQKTEALIKPNALQAQSMQLAQSMRFEENKGQVANTEGEVQNDILFTLKDKGMNVYFRKDGLSYQWQYTEEMMEGPYKISEATGLPMNDNEEENSLPEKFKEPKPTILHTYRVDMQWQGTNENVQVVSEQPFEVYNNYYHTHCPDGITNVKSYAKLTYKNMYPGIDVQYYIKDGHLKYDVLVAAGADLSRVKFAYVGETPQLIEGKIKLSNSLGWLEEQQPVAWNENGEAINIEYEIENEQVSFGKNKANQAIIIDPGLIWGTYYGNLGDEIGFAATVDGTGNVYLGGQTSSNSAIASGGHQNTYGGGVDAFLVKFNATGTRQWGTYYGGSGDDYGNATTADGTGNVYLGGSTTSGSAIASGGHQNTFGGNNDAFLIKLNSSGVRLWGTYYGGTNIDLGYSIATDDSGFVYLGGETLSSSGIASGGHDNSFGGASNYDAFLVKFNSSTGVRQWGTYYGDAGGEFGRSIATDDLGNVFLAGYTPTTASLIGSGGHQTSSGGGFDAFLVKFNSGGLRQWGTFYGGSGSDYGGSVATDASGDVFLAGYTSSTASIAFGGHQNTLGGSDDAFFVKFNSSGVRQWGTYYGATNNEKANSISADAFGDIYLTGTSNSIFDIASGGYQNTFGGDQDAFLIKFNTNGVREWGSYYGGVGADYGNSAVPDGVGNVYLVGVTTSSSSIASGGHQNTFGGGNDGFLVKLFDTSSITAVDGDGNTYVGVEIGTQVWLTENLKTTKFNDGTNIPLVTNSTSWNTLTTPGYCWYNNDQATYGNTYGALYNWYVTDIVSNGGKNVCPSGWSVPSEADWDILENYLTINGFNYDGSISGNKYAKSLAAITNWSSSNVPGSPGNTDFPSYRNKTFFKALPAGNRFNGFENIGALGFWWSRTVDPLNGSNGIYKLMEYNLVNLARFPQLKYAGFSIRCLKSSSSVPTVSSFTPTSGPVGTLVTITGTNFSTTPANNIVKFNGIIATITGTPTATSIVATVPSGATTGKIAIVEVGGQVGTSTNDFTVVSLSPEPLAQPTNFTVVDLNATDFTYDITAAVGGADGYLHIYKVGSAPTAIPVDGVEYFEDDVLPDGSIVRYADNVPAGNFYHGLTPGTTYHIKVFSYNGSGTSINYLTAAPLSATITTLSGAAEPTNQPTGLAFTSITSSSYAFSFTAAVAGSNAPDGYIGIRRAGAAPTSVPVDGVTYVVEDALGDGFINFVGTGTSYTQSGVSAGTTYHLTIFSYKGSGSSINYKAVSPLTGSVTTLGGTLASEPTNQPTALVFSNITPTSYAFTYTAAVAGTTAPDGYIGIRKTGSAPTAVLVDGVTYNVGDNLGDGNIRFIGALPGGGYSESDGLPLTTYHFAIYSYKGIGSAINYKQVSPLTGSVTTISTTAPTINSFNPTSGPIGTSVTITGTNFSTTASNNMVRFNGILATITGTPTATSIIAIVPTGATTGVISISKGSEAGASSTLFTVTAASAPTITLIAPSSGPVGTPVTITGTNFSTTAANNIVKFNGTTATITGTPTATSIVTSVPTGATTGKISVEVAGQTGTSLTDFTVNTVTVATEPTNQPTALTFSSITSSSYSFSFTAAVAGTTAPDGYIGIRRIGSAPTSAPVDGITYAPGDAFGGGFINFIGTDIEYDQTSGTVPASTYHLAIYSYKGSGTSINYKQVSPLTGSVTTLSDVDTTPPTITGNTTVKTSKGGDPIKVSITAADAESGIASAVIYYGESTSFDWTVLDEPMTKVGNNWEYTIPGNVVKELGIEYKVIVSNGVGDEADTGVLGVTVTTDVNGPSVPFSGAGTAQSNYKIISIPLALESKTVNKIFGDDFGDYGDKSKWRMFRYSGGSTKELSGSSNINPGEAYWLISSVNATIDTGPGTTVGRISDPFTIQVTQGFNQIGNPYPINLLWADVQAFSFDTDDNSNLGLGKLRVFNGTGFDDGLVLKRFEGGFVMAAKSGTLVFPAEKNSAAGRTEEKPNTTVPNAIDGPDWEVNFELTNGIQAMNFGGIGMNKKASDEYDAYDDFTLPRFLDYIELNHASKELYNLSYTKDIVPSSENHTWEFSVESNSKEVVTMKWDNSFFGNNNKQLVLWDVNLQKGLDMRTEKQYIFSNSRSGSLKVFYGDEKYIKEKTAVNQLVFHDVFPNPAKDNVTISFSLPKEDRVTIEVIDLLGKKIATVADGNFKEGYHEVTWNTLDNSGNAITNGIYITQIKGLKSDHQKRLSINK